MSQWRYSFKLLPPQPHALPYCKIIDGLVRRCLCRDTHEKCVRTSSVAAPHHQEVNPRGALKT
jgi:hypothetical protein